MLHLKMCQTMQLLHFEVTIQWTRPLDHETYVAAVIFLSLSVATFARHKHGFKCFHCENCIKAQSNFPITSVFLKCTCFWYVVTIVSERLKGCSGIWTCCTLRMKSAVHHAWSSKCQGMLGQLATGYLSTFTLVWSSRINTQSLNLIRQELAEKN